MVMSPPVIDQANLCGTSAAAAYLTLNKTPRPPQQSQTVWHQSWQRRMQNQGADQPSNPEIENATNPSGAKTR